MQANQQHQQQAPLLPQHQPLPLYTTLDMTSNFTHPHPRRCSQNSLYPVLYSTASCMVSTFLALSLTTPPLLTTLNTQQPPASPARCRHTMQPHRQQTSTLSAHAVASAASEHSLNPHPSSLKHTHLRPRRAAARTRSSRCCTRPRRAWCPHSPSSGSASLGCHSSKSCAALLP